MSDGEEGNTSDHSNSPDELATKLEDELAEKLDDMLSQTPEIPIEISTQSDGLSDKECAVRRVKTQMSLGKLCADEHSCEVSWLSPHPSPQWKKNYINVRERNPRARKLEHCLENAVVGVLRQSNCCSTQSSSSLAEEWVGESSTNKAEHNVLVKMSVILGGHQICSCIKWDKNT